MKYQIDYNQKTFTEIQVGRHSVIVKKTPEEWLAHQFPSRSAELKHPAWDEFFAAICKGRKTPLEIASYIYESALEHSSKPTFDRDQWEQVATYAAYQVVVI